MMRSIAAIIVILAVTSTCAPARATITAFWQPVTITPAAIADDPQLATMQTWDLMVTTSGDWASASMIVRLFPSGSHSFYRHPVGSFTRPPPASVETFPALAFTTHVTSPNDDGVNNNTALLGGHGGSPVSLGEASSPSPGFFSVGWGDVFVDVPGTFQIARLTLPQGAIPLVYWDSDPPTIPLSSATSQASPLVTTIIPQIPEPSPLSCLGTMSFLIALRRAARSRTATARRRTEVGFTW